MQSWTRRDFITYLILFILLFIRFPVADFTIYINKYFLLFNLFPSIVILETLQSQSLQFFYDYSLILVLVVVTINRSNINELNIDKNYIFILLGGGLAYLRNTRLEFHLVLIVIVMLVVSILYARGLFNFGDSQINQYGVFFSISAAFLLGVLFIIDSVNFEKINLAFQWFINDAPSIIVEEVVFRGMLWIFLKKLKFSEYSIVILQAILFWISHIYFASENPVSFWIIVPIASIILGVIVSLTRSITASVYAHILFNTWWTLFVL